MKTSSLVLVAMLGTTAHADDRADCAKGDRKACARIGRLKQLGALKPDGSRDVNVLITACGKALDAAKMPSDFGAVARPCGLLFSTDLQRAYDALGGIEGMDLGPLLATGYAEAYCPALTTKVEGCNGRKAQNLSNMKPDAVRAALSALNAAALVKELGADKAKPLAAKFDAAWPRLLGK